MTSTTRNGIGTLALGAVLLGICWLWSRAENLGGMYIATAIFCGGVFAVLLGVALLVTAAVQSRQG